MRTGKIVMVVIGALLALIGFGAVAGGSALLVIHATQRDGDGFYQSSAHRLQTSTATLVARLDLTGAGQVGDLGVTRPLGTLRVSASPVAGSGPLFIGVAPRQQLDRWLAGSGYERIVRLHVAPFRTDTEVYAGARSPGSPVGQGFWVASATGTGTQTLVWSSRQGDWVLVLMNADGHTGVLADVSAGVRTGLLLPIGLGLGAVGLLVFAGGLVLMLVAVRGAAHPGAVPAPQGVPGTYPVRLDSRLDEPISRWLWLVKWVLVIPHVIVLVLLWIAVIPLTAVAGVAILFTGRYPRSIFDFNVGVLRWSWRVSHYAYSALGTDRYPPFSLHPDPAYPAEFTVDYPERLSRGLVLVKWWLLAIPHYLIAGLFGAGATLWIGWSWDNGRRVNAPGGGLIGLLVLVAAVILLISGRYPRQLYDVVLGMNRWCFRVLAYAMLMRDEYPPFRLDTGGADPGTVPAPPPPPAPSPDMSTSDSGPSDMDTIGAEPAAAGTRAG